MSHRGGVWLHQAMLLCWPEQEPVSYTEACTAPDAAAIEATLLPPTAAVRPEGVRPVAAAPRARRR